MPSVLFRVSRWNYSESLEHRFGCVESVDATLLLLLPPAGELLTGAASFCFR